MAIRTKTIEVPFDSRTTTLASATTHTFTTQTIFIPEVTSRTFRSVKLKIGLMDAQATAASLTAVTVGITLGAAAAGNQAFTNSPPGNSGEHQSYVLERDVTAYFNTNFGAGASQTCSCTFIGTGPVTVNHSAKLIITYEYEDAAATTRVKTVRIPIESVLGALTTTLTAVGSSQIPNLDTFLPEASKVYRHIWFEVIGNDFSAGTANDPTLNFRIDAGGTTHNTGAFFTDLASARSFWYLWNAGTGAFTTSAPHDLHLASSNITTAATFNHVGLVLCVNYEYNHDTSTTVMNSLLMPMESIDFPGSTAAADESRSELQFYVEEPATVTLVQSGVLVMYTAQGAVSPSIGAGAQTRRTYTDAALLYCGAVALTQRIDSGSAAGAGHTLTRGLNKLRVNIRIATTGNNPTGFNILAIVNYTSPKSAQGEGVHNHSVYYHINDAYTAAAAVSRFIAALAPVNIPEAAYLASCIGTEANVMFNAPVAGLFSVQAELGTGELKEDGWLIEARSGYNAETENGWWLFVDNITTGFRRWPGDTSDKALLEASRRWRIVAHHSAYVSLGLWVTYSSPVFTVGGDVSGSAGGTVNLSLHRVSDGEKLLSTTRIGNGAYAFTWHDNTENLFVEARESSTLIGRSDNSVAVGSP